MGKSDIRGKNLKKLSAFFDVSESYILGYTEHRNSIDLTKIFEEMKKNGFKPTPINENSEDYLEYEKFVAEIEEENEANRKIFYKKYDTNEEEVLRFKSLLELFNELTESGQKEVIKFTKYLLQSQNESTDI
jgi:pentatricopeptide repeat protein